MGWGRARSGHEHSGKMAGAEVEADVRKLMGNLRQLGNELRELGVSVQSSGDYCQRFCQVNGWGGREGGRVGRRALVPLISGASLLLYKYVWWWRVSGSSHRRALC